MNIYHASERDVEEHSASKSERVLGHFISKLTDQDANYEALISTIKIIDQ